MREQVEVGPCECGGYGVVLSEEYERCHIPVSDVPGGSGTAPDDPALADLHEGRYGQLAAESLAEYRKVLKVMEGVPGLGTYADGDSFRHYAHEAEENGYDWVARMFRHAAWIMDERAHLRCLIRRAEHGKTLDEGEQEQLGSHLEERIEQMDPDALDTPPEAPGEDDGWWRECGECGETMKVYPSDPPTCGACGSEHVIDHAEKPGEDGVGEDIPLWRSLLHLADNMRRDDYNDLEWHGLEDVADKLEEASRRLRPAPDGREEGEGK